VLWNTLFISIFFFIPIIQLNFLAISSSQFIFVWFYTLLRIPLLCMPLHKQIVKK
jgi:hypothetical protein